jgi:hypothetical protein
MKLGYPHLFVSSPERLSWQAAEAPAAKGDGDRATQ